MKALALDLGGSGGKIFSGNFDGRKLSIAEVHRFHNEPIQQNGHLVWDIPYIYSNLLEGLRKSADSGFSSFGVDSFSNDYGLLGTDGKLIPPVFMYRDIRTEGVPEWMDKVIPPRELYERTGCQRARFNTLVQLVSQVKANDPILAEAETLLFLPDLLNYFLSGQRSAEYTVSSVSQLYNRKTNGWDHGIMDSLGILEKLFQKVIPSATILGQANKTILDATGCQPFSICTVGHHDTASAVAAVPSLEKHYAYISSGTWSLMGTETDGMITTDAAFQNNFANEGGVGGRNRFLKNIMGLWLVQECQRQFAANGTNYSYEEMDREAELSTPFRSVIDPDDALFFDPGDMIGKIQSKCREWDQPKPVTVGEITRCIKESLALTYRATLEKLEQITGFHLPTLHIIGGGARSSLLNQFAASAMKRTVLAGPYEAAAVGNLCAQLIAGGELKDLVEARRIICSSFEICEFHPQIDSGWDEAFVRFKEIKRGFN